MATKRMISRKITETDTFLDMPLSSQCLYFHLNMGADDEGFIANVRTIQRMVGANNDDLNILITRQFIIPFESGIVVIKDWYVHNYIAKDRFTETIHTNEKQLISLNEDKVYTECIQGVHSLQTQSSVVKSRVVKSSKEKNKDMSILVETKTDGAIEEPKELSLKEQRFETFWQLYPKKQQKISAKKAYNKITVEQHNLIMQDLEKRKRYKQWLIDNRKWVPNPATYINAGSWLDEYETL